MYREFVKWTLFARTLFDDYPPAPYCDTNYDQKSHKNLLNFSFCYLMLTILKNLRRSYSISRISFQLVVNLRERYSCFIVQGRLMPSPAVNMVFLPYL